jgi:Fe-S-cluster containining protein
VDFTCPNNVIFECCKCGLCCGDTKEKNRHVLLLEQEANVISTETCLLKETFTTQIANKDPYCYEMKKNNEGKCFFLKDNQCSIYELRPLICRFYPFELKFDPIKNQYEFNFTFECPGITKGRLATKKDFEDLFSLAKKKLL